MDGDEFADAVAVAYAGLGAFALILQVLGGHAHAAEGEEDVILADKGGAFQVVVAHQEGAGADFHFRTDYAIRADLGALRDPRQWVHDGGRMNRHWLSGGWDRVG